MEQFIERLLYSSRWLLAPIYIGLSLALVAVGIKFFQEIFHVLPMLFASPSITEANLVLVVLALVDMAMVASLIVMVMFSGYENFVSKIDIEGSEKLDWMGKLDAGTLKQKIAATIVAISSIHLLQRFIGAEKLFKDYGADAANDMLLWYVIMHLTFVGSAIGMGLLDKSTKHSH